MQGAGIRQFSGSSEVLDLPGREELGADELLIGVHGAGVGNWDNFARVGQWDLGRRPPMALGVEAAGVVRRVGPSAGIFAVGDRVLAHCAPFRDQGAWAEEFLVPVAAAALLPETVPFDEGAAFPVPALTAAQVLEDALAIAPGQVVLVNGAGRVTITVGARYPLEAAEEALSLVRRGAGGNAVVLAVRGA